MDYSLEDVMDIVFKKFGLSFRNNKSLFSMFILSMFYLEFFVGLHTLYKISLSESKCQFMEMGCLSTPKYRLQINSTVRLFRILTFMMLNDYFISKHSWLRLADQQFLVLRDAKLIVPLKSISVFIKKAHRIALIASIAYDVVASKFISNDIGIETFLIYLSIFFHTYLSGCFFVQCYAINFIIVRLFRRYNGLVKSEINKFASLRPETVRLFWPLYLTILNLDVFRKRFYVVLMSCLFGIAIQIYWLIFFTETGFTNKIAFAFFFMSIISFIVYFSYSFGECDILSKILAKMVYKLINVDHLPSIAQIQYYRKMKVG